VRPHSIARASLSAARSNPRYRASTQLAEERGHVGAAPHDHIATLQVGDEGHYDARCELADYRVNRLSGKRFVMYAVATREMPARSLLCLKRNVDEQAAWAFGKEFKWCRPVPREDATALAWQDPELTLRTEPAHREAFVALRDERPRLRRRSAVRVNVDGKG
jgi:hypothetical protein